MKEALTLAFLNTPSLLIERVGTLFDVLQHGDETHRAWLKEAIEAHLAGQPVPPPRSAK